MAGKAAEVDAGGVAVRVSSPDRVVFEATGETPEFTKLQVVEYFVAVDDGIMRALRDRPTALERWPKGVREGKRLTSSQGQGDAFYSKRVPKGAPDHLPTVRVHFPSGRRADEICPAQVADVAWAAHMGTITFHPWSMRRADVAHDLTPLLDLWAEQPTEMPYPPDYPKMPGEPKRVQPSKAKKG